MALMTGLVALGYMLIEEGRIVAIRHEGFNYRVDLDDINRTGLPRVNVGLLKTEGWEIGWRCTKCEGEGEIDVPCPKCSGRSLHSLLENPCCGGWDESACPDCSDGANWTEEY